MGPTNKELSIIMKLRDEVSKQINTIHGNLVNFTRSFQGFGKFMIETGRDMEKFGKQVIFIGASITGPLALAFKGAQENSAEVRRELERTSSIAQEFQLQIANAMLPVVSAMNDLLAKAAKWFSGLSQETKNAVVQGLLITGVFLSLGGGLAFVSGKVIGLAGSLIQMVGILTKMALLNVPMLLVVGAIVAIVYAMFKWKDVADVVMSTFQIMFNFLLNGFDTALAGVHKFVEGAMNGIAFVLDGLSKIPGPQQKAFNSMAENTKLAAEGARILADEALQRVLDRSREIQSIFETGEGDWSIKFQDMKEVLKQLADEFDIFREKLNEAHADSTSFFESLGNQLNILSAELHKSLLTVAETIKAAIGSTINNFKTGFGDAVAGMIVEGKNFGDSMKQVFKDMAATFIAEVARMIAQWLAFMALKAIGKFFGIFHEGGAVMHTGGMVRAHSGLAVDEVPIIAQRGEGILSRRGMAALGGVAPLNALNAGVPTGRGGGSFGTVININIDSPQISETGQINKLVEEISRRISLEVERIR